jgi:hypothetical protein
MKTNGDLAPPVAVDAVFVDVGRKITANPPEWLPLVLQRFAPSKGADDLDWLTKKTIDAIDHLLRFLPALENLRGLEGERKDVRIVLGLLLPIRKDFERALPKGTGRPQDAKKLICAGVMLEAWRLCRGSVEPHSSEFREACAAYWKACGGKPLADPTYWRHPIEKAKATDWGLHRAVMVAVKNTG